MFRFERWFNVVFVCCWFFKTESVTKTVWETLWEENWAERWQLPRPRRRRWLLLRRRRAKVNRPWPSTSWPAKAIKLSSRTWPYPPTRSWLRTYAIAKWLSIFFCTRISKFKFNYFDFFRVNQKGFSGISFDDLIDCIFHCLSFLSTLLIIKGIVQQVYDFIIGIDFN